MSRKDRRRYYARIKKHFDLYDLRGPTPLPDFLSNLTRILEDAVEKLSTVDLPIVNEVFDALAKVMVDSQFRCSSEYGTIFITEETIPLFERIGELRKKNRKSYYSIASQIYTLTA